MQSIFVRDRPVLAPVCSAKTGRSSDDMARYWRNLEFGCIDQFNRAMSALAFHAARAANVV